MTEYIFKISTRDKAHPLGESMILEFGTRADNPNGFIAALDSLVAALKELKTPEKVAEYMRNNAAVLQRRQHILLKG